MVYSRYIRIPRLRSHTRGPWFQPLIKDSNLSCHNKESLLFAGFTLSYHNKEAIYIIYYKSRLW